MGFIRGGLLVIAGVLLLLSLLFGNVFLTLGISLEYKNVKPILNSSINNILENNLEFINQIKNNFPLIESYCNATNSTEYVFNSNELNHVFVVKCNKVSEGPEALIQQEINNLIHDAYYKDYNCNFWDCFSNPKGNLNTPFFLISEKAKNYWIEKFYFSLIASLILIISIFVLAEKRTNSFFIWGSLLIISSLPLLALNKVSGFFAGNAILEFIPIFFNKSYTVFLISVLLGIAIISLGLLLKFFSIGFKISNFFNKFNRNKESEKEISKKEIKEIVKQEISNSRKNIIKKKK